MSTLEIAQHAEQLIWPLVSLLLGVVAARKLGSDLRPIFVGLVSGLSAQAQRYAYFFAYGVLLAITAADQELAKIATQFGWKITAAFAEVAQPGLVAFLAFMPKPIPPPDLSAPPVPSKTTPPFPPAPAGQ